MTSTSDNLSSELSSGAEKALATKLFNDTWSLIEKTDRTQQDVEEMVHSAHASAWHWSRVGDDQNRAISEWQVARVYCEIGEAKPAQRHAARALHYADKLDVAWLTASAQEGLARAYAVGNDMPEAGVWRDKAVQTLAAVADDNERKIIQADIDSLPM